jgi:site-specific DNA-methyltransferase (adenine-specific)
MRDIAARKHEAAAGEMWIALKAELANRQIDHEAWCRKNLGVTARSMEHRAYLHRHWDTYATARKEDDANQHGLVYAIGLVRHQLNIGATKGKTFHFVPQPKRDTSQSAAKQSDNRAPPAPHALNKSVTLWQADFRDALPLIPDHSVDLAIIDPPYFIRRTDWSMTDAYLAKNGQKARFDAEWDRFESLDDYREFTEAWVTEVLRTLKATGSMFVSGSYHNIGIVNFVLQTMEVPIVGDIIWLKRSARPSISTKRLRSTHETILWAAKSDKYRFNYYDVRDADYETDPLKKAGTQMGSVWQIPTVNQFRAEVTGHPSQKPLALYRRIFDMCGVEGGTVLDPMAGSATTAVAAMRWGMKAILIEREATYCRIIEKRIAAESNVKQKVAGADTIVRLSAAAD